MLKWKWVLPVVAGAISLTAWITFAVGVAADWSKPVMIVLATIGAFGLEGVIWGTALALGISVFQARRALWRRLTSPLRQEG